MKTKGKNANRRLALKGFKRYLTSIDNPTLPQIQARPNGFIDLIKGKLKFVKRQIGVTQAKLERNAK